MKPPIPPAPNLSSRCVPGRPPWRAAVPALLALWAGVWILAADPPTVTGTRVSPSSAIPLGSPFDVTIDVDASPQTVWLLPPVPARIGPFTLARVRAVSGGAAGQIRLEARLQAFQTGTVPLPRLPVRWQLPGGTPQPLIYAPGSVEVAGLLRGRGPFAFQPPRGGLAPAAPPRWPWAVAGLALVLAGAGAGGWLWRRARHRRAEPAATPRAVDLAHFLDRFERALTGPAPGGTIQSRAGRLVEVFRDFLSWRLRRDFHPLTTPEIRDALAGSEIAGTTLPAVEQALAELDVLRFAPAGGGRLPALAEILREAMLELGSRREEAADVAGAAVP